MRARPPRREPKLPISCTVPRMSAEAIASVAVGVALLAALVPLLLSMRANCPA